MHQFHDALVSFAERREIKMRKILTVSIAAYNAEKDIERCLDSLIQSGDMDKLDVIVVNDGSMDKTSQIVMPYVEKYADSLRLIEKENGGHGSTINASIKYAVGKYYKILDSDDWVDSDNLRKLIEYLANNDIDMVLNPYDEISYSDHTKKKRFELEYGASICEKKYDIEEMNKETVLYMHSLTFKTDVMKKMGSIIDEHCFYVDMEYCVFPMLHVKSFTYLDYSVYQYLLGSQTQSMNMENLIKRREQHMKVTKRLVDFYNQSSHCLPENVRAVIQTRIKYAVYQQYKIYLNMQEKEAIKEVKEFDMWLKNESSELYAGPNGRLMKLIKLNRRTEYKFYRPLIKMVKMIKLL